MEGGPSCFRPGSTCPALLWIHLGSYSFRLQDCYPLWLNFPDLFGYEYFILISVHNPGSKLPVWPLPRSLAATSRIDVSFSSYGYLDVSVPRVPFSLPMYSVMDTCALPHVGSPIRRSAGQWICAPHRSLSQLITSFIGSQCQGIHLMLLLLDHNCLY